LLRPHHFAMRFIRELNGRSCISKVELARCYKVKLIDDAHQLQFILAQRPRLVVHATAADLEQLGLLLNRELVLGIDHLFPPHSRKVRVMGTPVCAQETRFRERAF